MKKKQTVRSAMGLVQFQFVDIIDGHYKYTNSDKYFKMQSKWKKHIPALRGRRQAIMLTAEKPANSKSGSSYDILGVFAILENHEELEYFNEGYWNAIRFKATDLEKVKATLEYADQIISELVGCGRNNHHYEATYQILKAITLAATPKEKPAKLNTTGLQF